MASARLPACQLSRLAVTAVGAILILGCGGSGGQTFDPKRADELTHAALISPNDLPGAGWTAAENDNFSGGRDLAPGAACDTIRALFAESDKGVAGRAQRRLEQRRLSQTLNIVEVEIQVHESNAGLTELLARVRKPVSDGTLMTCFTETFKLLRSDPQAKVTSSTASAKAPGGGIAFADDRDITGPGGRNLIHHEGYIWLRGNVTISVDVIALKDRFDDALVKAALEKTSAAVDKAAKAK